MSKRGGWSGMDPRDSNVISLDALQQWFILFLVVRVGLEPLAGLSKTVMIVSAHLIIGQPVNTFLWLVLSCVNPLASEGREYGECQAGPLFILLMVLCAVIGVMMIIMISCWCRSQVRGKLWRKEKHSIITFIEILSIIISLNRFRSVILIVSASAIFPVKSPLYGVFKILACLQNISKNFHYVARV